jgi:hypothetical protein
MPFIQLAKVTLISLVLLGPVEVLAQTPLHKAPPDHSNPCAGVGDDTEALAECGMEAARKQNYDVARNAWSAAAERGDYVAAIWLGGTYDAVGGEKNYVLAYKWYEIAAAVHGEQIDKLPPGSDVSNQREINYREEAAKHLAPDQIAVALNMAREWLIATARKRAR